MKDTRVDLGFVIVMMVVGILMFFMRDHDPFERAITVFVILMCIIWLISYRKYTKKIMKKTGTHYDGKPLTDEEKEELYNAPLTLQCSRCFRIMRDQPASRIHTKCPRCGEMLHEVTGFVD